LPDFADTCVFAKQSPGPILCGPLQLPSHKRFTYHGLPFSRSYGDILPSSFSMDHSRTLGFSPRLRVSVYGTVSPSTPPRGFSRRYDYEPLAGPEGPFGIGARLAGSFIPPQHLPPCIGTSTTRRSCHSRVPPQGQTHSRWYRNIDLFPIAYAFRPRLRNRLTRSG
jgi:hypothetical protein